MTINLEITDHKIVKIYLCIYRLDDFAVNVINSGVMIIITGLGTQWASSTRISLLIGFKSSNSLKVDRTITYRNNNIPMNFSRGGIILNGIYIYICFFKSKTGLRLNFREYVRRRFCFSKFVVSQSDHSFRIMSNDL